MRSFIIGFLLGGLLMGSLSASVGPKIVGSSGYLYNWTVEIDGSEVCESPHVDTGLKIIECEE